MKQLSIIQMTHNYCHIVAVKFNLPWMKSYKPAAPRVHSTYICTFGCDTFHLDCLYIFYAYRLNRAILHTSMEKTKTQLNYNISNSFYAARARIIYRNTCVHCTHTIYTSTAHYYRVSTCACSSVAVNISSYTNNYMFECSLLFT